MLDLGCRIALRGVALAGLHSKYWRGMLHYFASGASCGSLLRVILRRNVACLDWTQQGRFRNELGWCTPWHFRIKWRL